MRWRKLETSENVQDRRGMSGKTAAGLGGAGLIGLLLALFGGLLGGDGDGGLGDLLNQVNQQQPATEGTQSPEFEGIDESEDFVRRVLGSTETTWEDIFTGSGRQYNPATLVLFSGATQSACGGAQSAIGPHYCPVDTTVYIDLDFFGELQQRFGAGEAEFAQAYVIAHEIGHHVQNELGIMSQVQQMQQQDPANANELSVRLELQADCLAGIWANNLYQREDVLQPGDIQAALDAAAAVGDDNIQRTTTGQVSPESWTHGSSEQRMQWFTTGYETGDPNQCNTF
ncbi:MAG: KPN_02809 family neutral zinc metallopeptidase [Acidimicrobiia bacterium]